MSNAQNQIRVKTLFERLRQAVAAAGWTLKDENSKVRFPELSYTLGKDSDALPTMVAIHPEQMLLMVVTDLQIEFGGGNHREMSVAMQLINQTLELGCFDTFIERERVGYRLSCFCGREEPRVEYLTALLSAAANMAKAYDSPLTELDNAELTTRQFAKKLETIRPVIRPELDMNDMAKEAFANICKYLKERDYTVSTFEGALVGSVCVEAKESAGETIFSVDIRPGLIRLRRRILATVSPLRRLDIAAAVNYLNSQTNEGYFQYKVADGVIDLCMAGLYSGGPSDGKLFAAMLETADTIESEIVPPLCQLNDGKIELWQFRNQV